jgi:hypothetical protein
MAKITPEELKEWQDHPVSKAIIEASERCYRLRVKKCLEKMTDSDEEGMTSGEMMSYMQMVSRCADIVNYLKHHIFFNDSIRTNRLEDKVDFINSENNFYD